MAIDWNIASRLVASVIGAIVAVVLTIVLQRKPRLLTYLGHVSNFTIPGKQNQNPIQLFTHSIAVWNAGTKSATNVRICHNVLPDFLFPGGVPGFRIAIGCDCVDPNLRPHRQALDPDSSGLPPPLAYSGQRWLLRPGGYFSPFARYRYPAAGGTSR